MQTKMLIAAMMIAAVPATVHAEVRDTVVIDASNIGTPAGMKRFRTALNNALDQMCGAYGSTEHDQWLRIDECREAAMRSVDRQLAAREVNAKVRLATR